MQDPGEQPVFGDGQLRRSTRKCKPSRYISSDTEVAQESSQSKRSAANEEAHGRDPGAQQPTAPEFRKCRQCGVVKGRDAFALARRRTDGLSTECRTCQAERLRERYLKLRRRGDVVVPESKRCPRCDQLKPSSDFCIHRGSVNGLNSYCRPCVSARDVEYKIKKSAANAEAQGREPTSVEFKFCRPCGTVKGRDAFARNRSNFDGLQRECRECVGMRKRELLRLRDDAIGPESKRCARCDKVKPASHYSICRINQDGLDVHCQSCVSKYGTELVQFKACRRCGVVNGRDGFSPDRRRADGLQSECRTCNAQRLRERHEKLRRRDDVVVPESKRCPRCEQVKPTCGFSSNRCATDGLHSHCKICVRATQKRIRAAVDASYEEAQIRDPGAQQPTAVEFKLCRICGVVKGRDDFPLDKYSSDGLQSRCRACRAEWGREHLRKMRERDHIVVPESKRCPRCEQVKPASEYFVSRGKVDGLSGRCKSCETEARKDARNKQVAPESKRCPRCGQTKPASDYHAHYAGLQIYCKPCASAMQKEFYQRKEAAVSGEALNVRYSTGADGP